MERLGQSGKLVMPIAVSQLLLAMALTLTPTVHAQTIKVTATFNGEKLDSSTVNRLNQRQADGPLQITLDPDAELDKWKYSLSINGNPLRSNAPAATPVDLTQEEVKQLGLRDGLHKLEFRLTPNTGDGQTQVHTFDLHIDRTGPQLVSADVVGTPEVGLRLVLQFAEDDLDPQTVKRQSFDFYDLAKDSQNPTANLFNSEPTLDGRRVTFYLGRPAVGTYRVKVRGSAVTSGDDPVSNRPLADLAGNPAGNGTDQVRDFVTLPGAERGEHVEFPRFVKSPPLTEEDFNPGDHVETRVARLYYFRDAHRVAQIINRTARPHRAAEVDQAERRASDQRERADGLTRDRQQAERKAEEVARQLRQTEARLSELQSMEQQRRRLESTVDDSNSENEEAKEAARNQLRRLPEQEEIASAIGTQRSVLAGLQDEAVRARDQREKLQFDEDRAREQQFRLEVASAKEDPDTYAPAKVGSIDPVAQVSVSVIGEGVLQLRGPIAGINRIRTMIDQIDTPLGQVRVDLVTVQLNGERGDRLEEPVAKANAYVDLSRFLTSQSLALLRRAMQSQAAMVAEQAGHQGHYQVDRDRKYLYTFFGRDFIDELYEMDSEFLHSENKLLSLHSMDTVSLNQALFILSLARRDVRQQILEEFRRAVLEDLPQAEWDYRRSAGLVDQTHHPLMLKFKQKHCDPEPRCVEQVFANAAEKYHFGNFRAMFDQGDGFGGDPDTMTPLQREFIRLAQIFKARMIAEVELKQRIVERGLIQSNRRESFQEEEALREKLRKEVLEQAETVQSAALEASRELSIAQNEFRVVIDQYRKRLDKFESVIEESKKQQRLLNDAEDLFDDFPRAEKIIDLIVKNNGLSGVNEKGKQELLLQLSGVVSFANAVQETKNLPFRLQSSAFEEGLQKRFQEIEEAISGIKSAVSRAEESARARPHIGVDELRKQLKDNLGRLPGRVIDRIADIEGLIDEIMREQDAQQKKQEQLRASLVRFLDAVSQLLEADDAEHGRAKDLELWHEQARNAVSYIEDSRERALLTASLDQTWRAAMNYGDAILQRSIIDRFLRQTRKDVDHIKLLDFLIDERQEKFIELQEGTRAHLSWMDNYLKRLAVALEDDFKVQFQEPAFAKIRQHARSRFVTLSQIERTSILTNNRALGKVTPQATMEFDLPKRKLALVEAFEAAKAVAQDAGALLNDPTFLATFQMMGGGPNGTSVQGVIPTLPSSTDQAIMGINAESPPEIGAALQALVPPPAIYKFETGTGYEIRPVIQPDGHSCVFDLLYMYTTNIREPVGGDEKHLGRVRRHFIDTQVQLASFEMRELSRYQVALKAARTAQGVPLLQDIPLIGVAFRPLPSAESSIQQNIILGHSIVYPTLFDMMGLRWAPAVIDLDHKELRNLNHVVRGRNRSIEDAVFGIASGRVDEMLDLRNRSLQHVRPDLYHPQRAVSPYHPNGFTYQTEGRLEDPRGDGFEIRDRRPPEMRDPPYDQRFRSPIRYDRVPPAAFSGDPHGDYRTDEYRHGVWRGQGDGSASAEEVPAGPRDGVGGQPEELRPPVAAGNESGPAEFRDLPESQYQAVPQRPHHDVPDPQFREIPGQPYQNVPAGPLRLVPEAELRGAPDETGREVPQPDGATQGRRMVRPLESDFSADRSRSGQDSPQHLRARYAPTGEASPKATRTSDLLPATFVDAESHAGHTVKNLGWQREVPGSVPIAKPVTRRHPSRLPPVGPEAR